MANASMSKGGFWQSIFQVGLYKPSQGRITRQATGWILFALCAGMAWRLMAVFGMEEPTLVYSIAAVLFIGGAWISYRVVNYPRFADFLIAVEAEMHKVSWPSWTELMRSSIVVIISMCILSALLFGFDVFWRLIFQSIGILG
jgi:preprotein translocase subunit SecE